MAWTAPMTAVADSVFTAAQFNSSVRDNLNETGPAIATEASRVIMTDGANSLTEGQILDDIVETQETTTSSSYTDLSTVGPEITMTTRSRVFCFINANCLNSDAANSYASLEVSGASSITASDTRGVVVDLEAGNNVRCGVCTLLAVTPGSNTFTMKYRVQSGTGTFKNRRLIIWSL